MNFLSNFLQLFMESAPWLLLGFFIAGIIQSLIPKDFLTKHLGGTGKWTTIKAAFIGAPLPLCSCGVVPAALGLRKAGASKNATVSFLVATPETGVDSISVTYALMGPVLAIVRPIAAITSGIVAGLLVGNIPDSPDNKASPVKSCCKSKAPIAETSLPLLTKLKNGLVFSYIDMLKDIAFWLLLGLIFAAAIKTWVPASFLLQWGDGFLAFVVMTLVGIPMYICATASTPIAAGLLFSGMSPGAVLVFMLAGPATNIGTMGIIYKELGRKSLMAYLSGVILVSYAFGFALNALLANSELTILHHQPHDMATSPLHMIAAAVLAVLLLNVYREKALQKIHSRRAESTISPSVDSPL